MKKFKHIIILSIISLFCLFTLTGCHFIHKWQPATCTEPETCIKCGKTRGFILGHDFVPVTCTEPKTCMRCGITQGWALGHYFTPANYQSAAGCVRCDIEDGDPLPADFDTYSLPVETVCGRFYEVKQMCNDDPSAVTTAKAVFANYKVFESDDTHTGTDGYLWHTIDMTLIFDDENMMKYGFSIGSTFEDYYNVTWIDNGAFTDDDGICHFAVNYNGIDYEECVRYIDSLPYLTYDDAECAIRGFRVTYLIPDGYDGCIIGLRNLQTAWDEGQYIYNLDNADSLFFRLAKTASNDDISENILTYEQSLKIINSFYNGISGYFDESILSGYDTDSDGSLSIEERADLFRLALSHYLEDNVVMSEEMTKEAAYDIISGVLKTPTELNS